MMPLNSSLIPNLSCINVEIIIGNQRIHHTKNYVLIRKKSFINICWVSKWNPNSHSNTGTNEIGTKFKIFKITKPHQELGPNTTYLEAVYIQDTTSLFKKSILFHFFVSFSAWQFLNTITLSVKRVLPLSLSSWEEKKE